jgi:nitric oxide reductase activation protein
LTQLPRKQGDDKNVPIRIEPPVKEAGIPGVKRYTGKCTAAKYAASESKQEQLGLRQPSSETNSNPAAHPTKQTAQKTTQNKPRTLNTRESKIQLSRPKLQQTKPPKQTQNNKPTQNKRKNPKKQQHPTHTPIATNKKRINSKTKKTNREPRLISA